MNHTRIHKSQEKLYIQHHIIVLDDGDERKQRIYTRRPQEPQEKRRKDHVKAKKI